MLNSMRNLSKSLVSKLLMLMLVVSFALWGIGDIARSGGSPTYAARVGGEHISIAEFQQQQSLMARQLEALGMKGMPPGQIELSVIQQLVQQKLSLMTMQDMGLVVNDELIGKIIAGMPEFQTKEGTFDAAAFKNILNRQNISEKTFITQLKRDVAGKFLTDSLDMRDATPPASVVQLESMTEAETRDAVLLTIPARAAATGADEKALREFYEANKAFTYQRPEQRVLDYVVLSKAEVEGLTADKKEGNLTRENALQQFANTIEDELAAGSTMSEAFKKAGVNATMRTLSNATAEMAKTGADEITRTVAQQGFSLGEGEISRLISTPNGTMLMVSAKKIIAAAPKPFEEVEADVAVRLAKQRARDDARATAASVKSELATSPNWQAVAQTHGLGVRAVSHIPRPMSAKATVDGLPAALQQAMFERKVGEVAGPLTLENGDQVLALVTQSRLPEKSTSPVAPKDAARMGEMLAQDIQGAAYEAFSKKHAVEINPAIMRQQAAE